MNPIRRAALHERSSRGIVLDCGGGTSCRISVLLPDLVRVAFMRAGAMRQARTWMVPAYGTDDVPWEGRDRNDESSWPVTPFRVDGGPDTIAVATGALTLTVTLAPFALTWALPDGRVFLRERPKHATTFGDRAIRHAFARHPDDRYFGLGDKTGDIDLHGRRLRTKMTDALGFDPERGDPLYKHWPFLIARDGDTGVSSGILYDNMANATFDLGCEHDNYYDLFRSYEAQDGDLDYYVFPGRRIADVTRKFLSLTGRPALPPRWTMGYAQTAMAIADSPNAQERIEQFIDTALAEDIPISAFHFGSGYTTIGPRRYVFNWNSDKFPDPHGLMRRFHEAGMHVVANIKPCLLDDHPRYGQPLEAGAYVRDADGGPAISQFWDGEGAHIDFTNPAGVAWWQRGLREQVLSMGMDVGWNDNNEYGFGDENTACAGFGEKVPLVIARAVQPLLMTRASLEEQQRNAPGERQFSVTRAGPPGIQRYAQTWSGDNASTWRSLKWNLRTGLTMSLSGMVNTGHDIGGFSGPVPDAELLVRFTQACLVHPRFIMNSWKPDGVYTSPWLHPEATPHIREAIRLRYRLIPYLYSLMHDATRNLVPPLLPTCAAFEDDPRCFEPNDEFMVGPSLLAAPVVRPGERARTLYLPRGPECWFDFWSGERFDAGAEATVAAPLDRLPLLVPAGAMLPMTDAGDDYSGLHDESSRCIRVYPGHGGGTSQFVLSEDDGLTQGGPSVRISFDLAWTEQEVTLTARADGEYAVPYDRIAVMLPAADRRRLVLLHEPGAPALVPG